MTVFRPKTRVHGLNLGERLPPACIDMSGDPDRPKPGTPEYSEMIRQRVEAFNASQETNE